MFWPENPDTYQTGKVSLVTPIPKLPAVRYGATWLIYWSGLSCPWSFASHPVGLLIEIVAGARGLDHTRPVPYIWPESTTKPKKWPYTFSFNPKISEVIENTLKTHPTGNQMVFYSMRKYPTFIFGQIVKTYSGTTKFGCRKNQISSGPEIIY